MLYLVPTPIGNLDDITLRALRVLAEVDLVAAEDTRHSGHLLAHHGISKPMLSFHEHNEARRTDELVARIAAGESVALVTDAGMPSVSDPGFRLVRACAEAGLPLTVLPGPCAFVAAAAGSGLPTDRIYFAGFVPPKSGGRERAVSEALARDATTAHYESPHRIAKTLAELARQDAERPVCVAREISKKFEEFVRGTAAEVAAHFETKPTKGEIVLLIAGSRPRKSPRPPRPGEDPC